MKDGRAQARRGHRHEPADRRDPRAGQPADLRQQPVRARHQQRGLREAAQQPRQAAPQPRDPGALPARLDLQARRRDRRARRQEDHADHQGRRPGATSRSGDPVLRLEPPRVRAVRHLLRLRSLERHVLLPGGRHARDRPARLLGEAVRVRRADRHRPARRGLRDRPDQPVEAGRLRAPIFPGEIYQAGHRPGLRRRDADPAHQRVRRAGQRRQRSTSRRSCARSSGRTATVVRAVQAEAPPQAGRRRRACSRRCATRPATSCSLRHTYNLVDLPIKIAGKSGTAEFGTRDSKGRLPFHSWFVGFVPKDPYKGAFDETDSQLVVLAFAYDSRTKGNAATEIVKYYLQLHFGIKKDYRTPEPPRARQLLPEQLMGVIRAEPARVTDWAAKSVGAVWRAFDLQLDDLRRPAGWRSAS